MRLIIKNIITIDLFYKNDMIFIQYKNANLHFGVLAYSMHIIPQYILLNCFCFTA